MCYKTSGKFSNEMTRCTYDLWARDLTRNYVGKNFRRPHDKYQPKVSPLYGGNIKILRGTITVRYLSSLTITFYFRYFSWHPRSSRARDLPFVINYKIPHARERIYGKKYVSISQVGAIKKSSYESRIYIYCSSNVKMHCL